ncbi:hydroxysteroid 11-beta-dehydrogenase 1-like protein [Anneissia japonica]|uniref:hydroxysteroid 11-beta-dehydrogenase 1-like protein n=1 Tax=Anneissia japonica TaxID=1529436 RepID=UPI0014258E7B|nr:hydroxysteroid 11-beta-dehydrogenase 1-like protein [Anneissia japonica]
MAIFTKATFILMLILVLSAYWMYDGFDEDSVKGKQVVITGASGGIGEQIAYHFARLGAKVLLTARREAVLKKVVEKCKELGAEEAFYIPLDMGNLDHTKRLIQEAKTKFGGLDYLILNHITTSHLELWKGDMERLEQIMNVNFRAYVSLATEALPMLEASKGSIGVVSSFAGKVGVPYTAPYCASKFALDGFFGALRQELIFKNKDVSITLCILGSIDTPNARSAAKAIQDPDMYSTSSADTALAIIRGTVTRQREVYYPHMIKPITLVRDWIPDILDSVIRSNFKVDTPE